MATRLAKTVKEKIDIVPAASVNARGEEGAAAESSTVLIEPVEGAQPHRRNSAPTSREIEHLYAALDTVTPENHPRTARLLAASHRKVAQKVIEEAGEVALAAVKHNSRNIVRESADLLYQLAVLWHRAGIMPGQIWAEMRGRAGAVGIAEKLPKSAAVRDQVAGLTADRGTTRRRERALPAEPVAGLPDRVR
ncbi:MAG: phosphoribosyl-ATP diphosphatase [Xanthobacteraceae bacterium]